MTDQPSLARAFRGQLKQDVQKAFTLASGAMEEIYPSQLSSKAELSAHALVFQQLYRTIMTELKVAEHVSACVFVNRAWVHAWQRTTAGAGAA